MKSVKRSLSMDLIRVFALFSLVCVHFFLNIGYYNVPMVGKRMYVMTLVRSFFMICVPLFIMLSGYLMCKKKLEARYYKGLIKTVAIYLLASAVSFAFKCTQGISVPSFGEFWLETAQYSAAPYSWYVEMYLGLFIIIPFLNVLYNGLDSKKKKTALVVTLMALTTFQSIFNSYIDVYPDFWVEIYPITYYFIGCYIREFPIKVRKVWLCLAAVAVDIALGTFTYLRCDGDLFKWGVWQKWGSIGVLALSVLVFLIIKDIEFKTENGFSRAVSWVFYHLSSCTFGAYCVSYIFDAWLYPRLNARVIEVTQRAVYMPVMVALVFVGSLLLSGALNGIYSLVVFIISKLIPKKKAE